MMGNTDRSEALFTISAWKIRVPETHLLRRIEKPSVFEFVRERFEKQLQRSGRPSIDPELLLRILRSAICTASPASGSWWRNCACPTWHGAGSTPVWASIRRSRITPRSRKTGTDGFRNRSCSRVVWQDRAPVCGKWDWCRASTCRSMAVSLERMPGRRAAFRAKQLVEAAQVNQTVRQYLVELERRIRRRAAIAGPGIDH